jgi:putative transposase
VIVPYFHVWFATKGRRKLLQEGDVLDAVRELIPAIAEAKSISLLEFEAVIDHVHMLIALDDKAALPRTMMLLKGISSRRVLERLPEVRLDAHTNSLWQAGYGSKIVSPDALASTRKYIRTQWDRLETYEA